MSTKFSLSVLSLLFFVYMTLCNGQQVATNSVINKDPVDVRSRDTQSKDRKKRSSRAATRIFQVLLAGAEFRGTADNGLKQYLKYGGIQKALEDFHSLGLRNIRELGDGSQFSLKTGRVDNTVVILKEARAAKIATIYCCKGRSPLVPEREILYRNWKLH